MMQNQLQGVCNMRVIGVTGGVGAGKSAVLDYLNEKWGAVVLRLDDVSRMLIEPGGGCFGEVLDLFGEDFLLADGSFDRKRIAGVIFRDEEKRLALNAIIHPAVKNETLRILEESRQAGKELFVIEAALLLEDHYDAFCDEIWYIYADADTRCRRLKESRGYDDARIRGTMAGQMDDTTFRAHADLVIDNSGEFDNTRAQIDRAIHSERGDRS